MSAESTTRKEYPGMDHKLNTNMTQPEAKLVLGEEKYWEFNEACENGDPTGKKKIQ